MQDSFNIGRTAGMITQLISGRKNINPDEAGELFKAFMSVYSESRFDFLSDIFPPSMPVPPLAVLAECGREAENNLLTNTRYSLICLGDIGEALAYTLLNLKDIPNEQNQSDRINMLINRGAVDKDTGSIFHRLRTARNSAVHGRYSPEADTSTLIDDALELCEKIFLFMISPGDILRGKIISNDSEKISVKIGKFFGTVAREEIPENFSQKEKNLFRVLSVDGEKIFLSLKNIDADPWAVMAEKYSKYTNGQEVIATVKRLTRSLGAVVELEDGLEARIPVVELSSSLRRRKRKTPLTIKAVVKWCDPEHFPYMVLSPKKIRQVEDTSESEAMPDAYFLIFCEKANAEDITRELEKGANAKAKDPQGMTTLMIAAKKNHNEGVITALINAGAKVNNINHDGYTALMLAAIHNEAFAVKELVQGGADISLKSPVKKTAGYYAHNNPSLRRNEEILTMLNYQEKPKRSQKELNSQLLRLCEKNGTPEKIGELLEDGADVNAKTANKSTPIMLAAQHAQLEIMKKLLEYKPNLNAQSKTGNTALHIAALHIHPDIMLALLKAGASWDIPNRNNMTAFEITNTIKKLKKSEAMKFMMTHTEPETQKNFLQLCRSGTEQEIQQAIDDGANINVRSKTGAGALTFAARGNTAGAVEVLLNAGIDPDAQDIHANTALIYAAAYNSDDVIDALIDGGADVNVINNEGRKALDYARQNYRLADTEALKTLEELTQA